MKKLTILYKLASVNLKGSSSCCDPVQARILSGVDELGVPKEFALYDNYPNPFNPKTTIRYHLAGAVNVSVDIYDISGRHVRTLVNNKQPAGRYSVVWNGTRQNGLAVASGIYIVALQAGEHEFRNKITLVQ